MGVSYGNGVKRPGATVEYTPEQVKELIKCGQDPIYFAENYYYIVHPVQGKMLIPFYDFQKDMVKKFKEHRKNIVLSSRQVGKTTCSAIFLLWYSLFNEDKFVALLANQQKTAISIIDEIKLAYESLPDWMKPGVVDYNKLVIKFENGTEIHACATSENALRGQSVSLLFLDEFAFVPENMAEAFWRSNYPTLSCVTKDTMLLTDNGFVELGEFIEKNKPKGSYYPIQNLNVWGMNGIENASDFYISPKTDIKKITTQYGLSLSATEDHPIYAINQHRIGMIKNKDIRIGDYVRVDYGMEIYGNNIKLNYGTEIYDVNSAQSLKCSYLTKEISYLLGLYISKGWISENRVFISGIDKKLKELFLNDSYVKFKEIDDDTIMSDEITFKLFTYLTGTDSSKEKTVPKIILGTTKINQQYFISGYIDGNGNISKKGIINVLGQNTKIISVLQQMLLNMGIISKIKNGKYLSISSEYGHQLQEFGLKINIDRLKYNKKNKNILIPAFKFIVNDIRSALKRNNISSKKCKSAGCRVDKLLNGKDKYITRSLFVKLVNFLDDVTLKFKYKDILENKCLFDRVVAFDYYQEDTYDLTCPETSSFLQNGILGSNTGGRVIIVSTPNGAAGKFYEIYSAAEKNENDFNCIRVPWDSVPGRDEAWKEKMIAEFGIDAFRQEFLAQFSGSSSTLIDGDVLAKLEGIDPPLNGIFEDGKHNVWIPPKPNHLYAFGVDTSQGVKNDYSVINIFDITTYKITGRLEQVAIWSSNEDDVFSVSDKIMQLAPKWNMPFIIVENNALGSVLAKQLYFEESYEHLFYDMNKGEYGVNSNVATKALALTHFKDDVESGRMVIRSKQMIKELSFFEEVKPGIFQARKGRNFHDDYVASAFWVSYMVKDNWFSDAYDHRLELMGVKSQNIVFQDQREIQTQTIVDAFMSSLNSDDRIRFDFESELWRD